MRTFIEGLLLVGGSILVFGKVIGVMAAMIILFLISKKTVEALKSEV